MRPRGRTRYLIISLGLALAGWGGLWHVECGLLGAGAADSLVSDAPHQLPTGLLAELRPIGPGGAETRPHRPSDKLSEAEPDNTASRAVQPTAHAELATLAEPATPAEFPRELGDDDPVGQVSGETAPCGEVQPGDSEAGATHKTSHSGNGAVVNIYHIQHVENLFVEGAPSPSRSSLTATGSQPQVPRHRVPRNVGVHRAAHGLWHWKFHRRASAGELAGCHFRRTHPGLGSSGVERRAGDGDGVRRRRVAVCAGRVCAGHRGYAARHRARRRRNRPCRRRPRQFRSKARCSPNWDGRRSGRKPAPHRPPPACRCRSRLPPSIPRN